ncbi:MAG: hypothetical protein JWP12_2001 [Bacteroidetes bacterium]|nr:hypothetical protein [Bacteroidota bacterium]
MNETTYTLSAGFRFGNTPLVLTGTSSKTLTSFTAELGDLTMVEIAAYLIKLVDPNHGSFKEFPAPWDFLNKINFKGLKLTVESSKVTGKNRVGISYPFSIDVGFAKITALQLYYTPGEKKVSIEPTGTLLGQTINAWEIYPKQDAPPVSGYGSELFDLKFLGLGQHISVKDMQKLPGIAETITKLRESFKESAKIVPASEAKEGQLIFDTSSGWMIGTNFTVIKTVDLSIIFNDPYMYGLALSLSGAKAKTFAGLNIELLYKKVTDSIGVYSLHLKLPDAMRQLEFGAVSFTLPVIDIAIYSNGNFRIDLGFPTNNDWSRVATVQVFPFIGAGGFYFALLTGATATRLPSDYDPVMGTFNPVIDFGLALRLGIGKTIDKGILKAGVSLCFQGIVTGTYGFFVPDPKSGRREDSYYYLNGQFEVVGKIYGEINFSIISARLDVMIYAAIGVVIEAYKEIVLYINAGVSLSLTVNIKLGFIKISIDLSFSTSVSYTFILPVGDAIPEWGTKNPRSLRNAAGTEINPYHASLTNATRRRRISELGSTRLLAVSDDPKETLSIFFLPQISGRMAQEIQNPQLKDQKASFIAGLFLDSGKSDDKQAGEFGKLARAYLKWLIRKGKEALSKDDDKNSNTAPVNADEVSLDVLKELFDFLSHESDGVPAISYKKLTDFLSENFEVQLSSPIDDGEKEFNVSIFPMLPALKMQAKINNQAPFINVDFSAHKVDSSYNETIQNYFAKLKVGYQNPLEKKNDEQQPKTNAIQQSLSTFIFQDYFMLLGRNLVQDCIDLMEAYPYTTKADENFKSLEETFKVTAGAVVNANPNIVLTTDQILLLGNTKYNIQKYDSFNSISEYYNFKSDGLIRAFLKFIADDKDETTRQTINLFIPGAKIKTGNDTDYICKTGDTLQSISESQKYSILDLLWINRDDKTILSTFASIKIPAYAYAVDKGMTFETLAEKGQISLNQLAINNAANEKFSFPENTNLVLPELQSIAAADTLVKGIVEKNSFRKLSGLASRYLMHGLRAPAPAEFANAKNDTYALYDLTKQLFDLPDTTTATSLTVTLSTNAANANAEKWFKVVKNNQEAISSTLVIDDGQLREIEKLPSTLFQPDALSVKKAESYTVNPGRFMLKAPSVWQANAPVYVQGQKGVTWTGGVTGASGSWPTLNPGETGFTGPFGWKRANTPKIWYFSDELTKAVQENKLVQPAFKLYMGRNNLVEKKFEKKEVVTYGWSTVIPLSINRIPSSLTQGQDMPTMFEIESTSEEGLQLLENLLVNQFDPKLPVSARVDLGQVHILYTPAASSDGAGLRSIDPSEVIASVVQSNLSTVRNPQALRAGAGSVGYKYGSFNQDPVNNIKRLWEACSVKSGGFYLYYFDNNTSQGIPSNVFDEKGHAQINIVITYGLPSQSGYNFLNSMTLGEMVPEDSYLFLESQQRNIVNLAAATTVEQLLTDYRLTIDHLAEKLNGWALKDTVTLEIRNIIFLVSTNDCKIEDLAKKFNVTAQAIRDLNPGLSEPYKLGDALRIPTVKYPVNKGEALNSIAAKFSVSVAGLLWANREQVIFNDLKGLTLSDQSQNKTSSVIPGTVSFNLRRKNPQAPAVHHANEELLKGASGLDPKSTLQLNYNLLTFAVKENPAFLKSITSMPVSPANAGGSGGSAISPYLDYEGVIPASSYLKPVGKKGAPSYPAPENNPYKGTGKIVQVNFDWQDMYGNRTVTPFNAPYLYPGIPYLDNFPQVIGYSDPLQSVLQWPSIGIDHLFSKKNNAPSLDLSIAFDVAGYQPLPGKGNKESLVKKAQADLETYRKAIYQLSAEDVKVTVSASMDKKPSERPDMKPALLCTLNNIFHYLSAFSIPNYDYLKDTAADIESLASKYRLSAEYIRMLNPPMAEPEETKQKRLKENTDKTYFLPNDNFYLYYTGSTESLTDIHIKLNVPLEELRTINPGVPEIPGDQALIVIPGQCFGSYTTDKIISLAHIARQTGVAVEVVQAANPGLADPVPAGVKLFIPYFNCSVYEVQEDDTLAKIAEASNVPVSVLNAVTYKHARPLQPKAKIIIPDNDFMLYTAKEGDTLKTLAVEKWIAYETLQRMNPAVGNVLTAGTKVLLLKTPVPLKQNFDIDFDAALPPVFAVEVAVSISRDPELVDESFVDQPEVSISRSVIPPHLSNVLRKAMHTTNKTAEESASLLLYADSFEEAFTDLKIATLGDKSASKNELYAVRLHQNGLIADNKKISYRLKNDAIFYAPVPLATYPLSASFYVPQYLPGQGFSGLCAPTQSCIGASGAGSLQMSFQGIQLDNVAEDLFESIDQMLQPDLTRALLQIDQFNAYTNCRQDLLDAKKKIAEEYSKLVKPVMKDDQPDPHMQADAGEALKQQMLSRLSNLYSIGTIVQLPVEVVAPATERASLIFGNPVNRNDKGETPDNRVTFSSAQVSLQPATSSCMTFVLSALQPAKNKNLLLDLAYKPLAMEFNIHPIPGISDYKASQWLFFVKPLAEVPIGTIDVPVPLRDFPVPPTPLNQEAKGVSDDEENLTLEQTRQWQYIFTFRNPESAAAQDLIYSSTLFNVDNYNLKAGAPDPDLFLGLATWSVVGKAMMNDMFRLLPALQPGTDKQALEKCKKLVRDYLSVVKYVASAVPYWLKVRAQKYQQQEQTIRNGAEFVVIKPELKREVQNFYIRLEPAAASQISLAPYPALPSLGNYKPTLRSQSGEESRDKYFFVDADNNYLNTEETKGDPASDDISIIFGRYTNETQRVSFGNWLNIMEQWNAWGGVYIKRNEYLFEPGGKKTNPDFVYRTPVVRPYNASAPLLDYSKEFDIHDLKGPKDLTTKTFEDQLRNMLYNFFDGSANPKARLKIVWSYSYCINPGGDFEQYVTLPGGLIPPFTFNDNLEEEVKPGSFIYELAAVIKKWLLSNEVPGADAGGRIMFDITAFSDLPDNKQPFYRLRNLFLKVKDAFLK